MRSGSVQKSELRKIQENPHVCVLYRNPETRQSWRFYGEAEVLTNGPVREQIMQRVNQFELAQDPERGLCDPDPRRPGACTERDDHGTNLIEVWLQLARTCRVCVVVRVVAAMGLRIFQAKLRGKGRSTEDFLRFLRVPVCGATPLARVKTYRRAELKNIADKRL